MGKVRQGRVLPDQSAVDVGQVEGRKNTGRNRRPRATGRQAPSLSDEEARFLLRLLLWLPQTESGDRAELRLSSTEEMLWYRFSAQNENCLGSSCPFVLDGSCFLLRARQRAEASHLVVVNHALLLSDVAVGGRVIPPYDNLIVDEGQHLEEEATRQLGFEAREADLLSYLDRLQRREAKPFVARRVDETLGLPVQRGLVGLVHLADEEHLLAFFQPVTPHHGPRVRKTLRPTCR